MKRVGIVFSSLMLVMSMTGCGGCDQEAYVMQSDAMITVNPSRLDFGEVPVGMIITKTIEVLNPGQMVLEIESTELDDESNVFAVGLPQDQVAIGGSMEIAVTFAPLGFQEYEATLQLVSNAENKKTTTITLVGEGTAESFCGDCNTPPQNQCLSAHDLLIYDNVGTCEDDRCEYQASQIYCEFGCDEENAVCLNDPGNDALDSGTDPEPEPELDAGMVPEPEPELDAGIAPQPEVDAGMLAPYTGPIIEEIQTGKGAGSSGWTCARISDGSIKCWGQNNVFTSLGNGPANNIPNPVPVAPLLPEDVLATALITGDNSITVATAEGVLYCWGGNCPHAMSSNSTGQTHNTPQLVSVANFGQAMDVGWGHACTITTGSEMHCWGSNWYGRLGTGDDVYPTQQPVAVTQLSDVSQMALGRYHTCGLQQDNKVFCWGYNRYHQVGTPVDESEICPNEQTTCVLQPREIQGIGNGEILDLAAGGTHTCAIDSTGEVYCWGNNQSGAIGDGNAQGFLFVGEPTETLDLGLPAEKLALGGNYSLAILEDGSLKAWGSNHAGQLGDGTAERQPSPVSVVGLPLPVLQVSAAGSHTCAVLEDHSAWCWGKNDQGQLGNGTTDDSSIPVRVVFPEDPPPALDAGPEADAGSQAPPPAADAGIVE